MSSFDFILSNLLNSKSWKDIVANNDEIKEKQEKYFDDLDALVKIIPNDQYEILNEFLHSSHDFNEIVLAACFEYAFQMCLSLNETPSEAYLALGDDELEEEETHEED